MKILSKLTTPFTTTSLQISPTSHINTISTIHDPAKPHLLLLHGWGFGVGMWINNIDCLATRYNVHAIDLLGWGLSSRPKPLFNDTQNKKAQNIIAQEYFVDSVEKWRQKMNIEKLSLVGHSMGGFVSASYAIEHPTRVEKLTLLSAIGLKSFSRPTTRTTTSIVRDLLIHSIWSLTPQRLAMILPTSVLKKSLIANRKRLLDAFPFTDDTVAEYLLQLAKTGTPTGAEAFSKLLLPTVGWTLSLEDKLMSSNFNFPIVLIYGENDWISSSWAIETYSPTDPKKLKGNVYLLPDAGHHGYAENFKLFNELVMDGEFPEKVFLKPVTEVRKIGSRVKLGFVTAASA